MWNPGTHVLQDDSYVTQPEKLGSESRNGSGGGGAVQAEPPRDQRGLRGGRGRPRDGDQGMHCTSLRKAKTLLG